MEIVVVREKTRKQSLTDIESVANLVVKEFLRVTIFFPGEKTKPSGERFKQLGSPTLLVLLALRERKLGTISWYTTFYFNGPLYGSRERDITWSNSILFCTLYGRCNRKAVRKLLAYRWLLGTKYKFCFKSQNTTVGF